jgi:hypothetical protein
MLLCSVRFFKDNLCISSGPSKFHAAIEAFLAERGFFNLEMDGYAHHGSL